MLSLKKKKKILKKDASYLKIAWHSKRQKKNIEKRERKTENEKTSNNNKYFFTLTFYIENLYFVRKHIWKNLVYIVTFVLQFPCVADYWKCSNKTTPIQICIGRVDAVHRHKILGNKLGINVGFDSNGLFLFFLYFREVPSIRKKTSFC